MHCLARALLTPQWLVRTLLYLDESVGKKDELWCFGAGMSVDVVAQTALKFFTG